MAGRLTAIRLRFARQRGGNFDIDAVPASGGDEVRLTTSPGYDDGPELLSRWQVDLLQFRPLRKLGYLEDARRREQVRTTKTPSASLATTYEDWFAHPSPDGKWLVMISFEKGTKGHPANQHVLLRRMRMPGAHVQARET